MKATLREVAKTAGVGTTTVSVILNKPREAQRFRRDTIEHVKQVAQDLGYQPNQRARSFRGGCTQVIGLAVEYCGTGESPLAEPYMGSLTGGIQAGLWAQGYNLLLVAAKKQENSVEIGLKYIQQGRIDGLILLSPPKASILEKNPGLTKQLLVIQAEGTTELSCVYSDDAAGASIAVKEMKQQGHQHLLWVGPEEWFDASSNRRAGAFIDACSEEAVQSSVCAFQAEGGVNSYLKPRVLSHTARDALRPILQKKNRPTAILCYNAQCATGVYQAISESGLTIPNDISVVTFEEFASNFFAPHLAAISLGWPKVGAHAAEQLVNALKADSPEPISLKIPPTWVPGQSLAKKK